MSHYLSSGNDLAAAVKCLEAGGIIAYPTEGVFGLGCDPFDVEAVQRIIVLKGRTSHQGFILLVHDWEQVDRLAAPLSEEVKQQMQATWPGHHTWLLPKSDHVPRWLTGQYDTIACRMPAFSHLRALLSAYGGPIVSTSANLHGQPPCMSEDSVAATFQDGIDYLLSGPLGGASGVSKIQSALTGEFIRG